jgi:hypothetical protein
LIDAVDFVAAPLARVLLDAGGADADPEAARRLGQSWRDEIVAALGASPTPVRLPGWDESPREPAFTVRVGGGHWRAIRLLAVLADRQEVPWPDEVPSELSEHPTWAAAEADSFERTPLAQIAVPDVWLPGPAFYATCRTRSAFGDESVAGSLEGLAAQLALLEQRTFQRGIDPASDEPLPDRVGVDRLGVPSESVGFVERALEASVVLARMVAGARAAAVPLFAIPAAS